MGITERQKDRTRGVGGSDIAKLFNVSKYGNVVDLWHEKLGRKPAFEGNKHTKRGDYIEGACLEFLMDQIGSPKIRRNVERRSGPLLVHLDAQIVGEPIAAECKSATRMDTWGQAADTEAGEEANDLVPVDVMLQVQAQMAAAKNVMTWVILCSPQFEGWFHLYRVEADLELQQSIVCRATDFWEINVKCDTEPECADPPSGEVLALVERVEGKRIELTDAALEWYSQYNTLGKLSSKCHAKRDVLKNKILQEMGDCTIGQFDRGNVHELKVSAIKGRVTRGKGKKYPDEQCETCGIGTRTGAPSVRLTERSATKRIEAPDA